MSILSPEAVQGIALSYASGANSSMQGVVSAIENALSGSVTSYAFPGVDAMENYTGAAGYAGQMMSIGLIDGAPASSPTRPSRPGVNEPGDVQAHIPGGGFGSMSRHSFSPPARPAPFDDTFNRGEPEELPITLPDRPTLPIRIAPVLLSLAFPDPVTLNIASPNFSSLYFDELIVPSNTFNFSPGIYSSTLLDPLKATLLDSLENGTFVNPQLWADTWNRSKDRRVELLQLELEDSSRQAARSGFALPMSHFMYIRNSILRKFTNDLLDVDRERAIKESETHIENRKFTIQEIKELEKVSMDFHLRSMELMLNAQKATLEMAALVFEASLKKHGALVEEYRLAHAQYLAAVDGELKRIEGWKVEMEGVKIKAEAQTVQVDLYKAQLQGDLTQVELYKAQMEGALAVVQVNKGRVEVFKAYVDAFTALVAAKEAEYRGYAAAAQAEGVKAEFMRAEAAQYAAQADAMRAEIEAAKLNLDAAVANNQVRASIYGSDVQAYGADIQKYGSEVQMAAAKLQASASVRSSALSAIPGLFGAEAAAHSGVRNAEAQLTGAHAQFLAADVQAQVNTLNAKAQAGSAAAQALSGLMTGALGMVNSLSAMVTTEDVTPPA